MPFLPSGPVSASIATRSDATATDPGIIDPMDEDDDLGVLPCSTCGLRAPVEVYPEYNPDGSTRGCFKAVCPAGHAMYEPEVEAAWGL